MSVPQKAATLEAAYRILEPRPLEDHEASLYYLPHDGLGGIKIWLRYGDPMLSRKWLVTGHKGIGKTTELRYLLSKFRETHLSVLIDAAEELNLGSLETLDLLLLVGKRILEESAAYSRSDETKRIVRDLLVFLVSTKAVREDLLSNTDAESEFLLLTVLRDFVLRVGGKSSDEERTSVRSQLGSFYPALVEKLNQLLRGIRTDVTPRTPVIVIDGLDRLAPEIAKNLFLQEAMLRQFDCMAIYTIPLSLRSSEDFQQLRHLFDSQEAALLNYAPFTRDGQPYEPGRTTLREMILKRIDPALINAAALERLIELSGGIPRELFYLARDACTFALLDEAACISLEHIHRAAQQYCNALNRMLTTDDRKELCQIYHDHLVCSSTRRNLLTYISALLEYEDGDSGNNWCNAHPVLHLLLETYCQDVTQAEATY